ncbi:hypothetical protein [Streptomyces sp. CNQ085]|uniref:hypothetical protein n=1 Tax=Streptomyces sp. CNQ085 TaxID=2886944 RepID=UPI001F513C3C|nr:hypothetical protein [Streptomyces sp. CNQ085]MCI0383861.1 hypothetical protein [Streptomyces sp. CNQ085]
MTAAMAFTLTACGGGDRAPDTGSSSQPPGEGGDMDGEGVPDSASEDGEVMATLNGTNGVNIAVTSAIRDQGGFVTVKGKIENTGDRAYLFDRWSAGDQDFSGKGASVGGMTLVDKEGKKRYYILRDTDNNCLCTMFPGGLGAGEIADFFAQFPAPPAETTEVDLQVPTMSSVTIRITDK